MVEKYDVNYGLFKDHFKEAFKTLQELELDGENVTFDLQAVTIAKEFIDQRFEFYLKHYNNDKNEIDECVVGWILDEYELFANVSYKMVAKYYTNDETLVNSIRKRLNSYTHHFNELYRETV